MPPNKTVGVIGYGRMGKVLEQVLADAGFHSIIIRDNRNVDPEIRQKAAGWIDFSEAGALPASLTLALETQKPLVIGTTGWYDQKEEIAETVRRRHGKVLWGANFDLMMQLMFILTDIAAHLLRHSPLRPHFHIHEVHHPGKKDAPSGTALYLSEIIRRHFPDYQGVAVAEGEPAPETTASPGRLPITYRRRAGVFGQHEVRIHTGDDTLRLFHAAHQRKGFARGALAALQWLSRQKPGFYSIDDFIRNTWLQPAGILNPHA